MSAKEHLLLAWQADRAGRHRLRDVMLTLAVAESRPDDSWAERGRLNLVRRYPAHFFSKFESVKAALANDEVKHAIGRLREKYPEARVEWQLLGGESSRGLFTGREAALSILLQELLGPAAEAEVRRDVAEPIRGPVSRARATVTAKVAIFPAVHSVVDVSPMSYGKDTYRVEDIPCDPSGADETVDDESVSGFYLSVLFSIALLLSLTQPRSQTMRRAS